MFMKQLIICSLTIHLYLAISPSGISKSSPHRKSSPISRKRSPSSSRTAGHSSWASSPNLIPWNTSPSCNSSDRPAADVSPSNNNSESTAGSTSPFRVATKLKINRRGPSVDHYMISKVEPIYIFVTNKQLKIFTHPTKRDFRSHIRLLLRNITGLSREDRNDLINHLKRWVF